MTQLLLDLGAAPAPSFDNFVPGGNGEALQAVRALATGPSAPQSPVTRATALYLWGPHASGKSHLLAAARRQFSASGQPVHPLDANSPLEAFRLDPGTLPEAPAGSESRSDPGGTQPGLPPAPKRALWTLDDCQLLDAPRQIAAFHLIDAVRRAGAWLIAAGDQPPAHLALMPELSTRLGAGLILQLRSLTDEEKAEALTRSLRERGLKVQDGVVSWLLTHVDRDLAHLRQLIDSLDTYALREKRPLTLALVRRWLQGPAP